MLIGILDSINNTQLLIGLGVVFIAQMVLFRYVFGRLNAKPADTGEEIGDRESEILGDQTMASTVGTPRLRRLQPSGKPAEATEPGGALTAAPEAKAEKTEAPVEKKSLENRRARLRGRSGQAVRSLRAIPVAASEGPTPKTPEAVPLPVLASALIKPDLTEKLLNVPAPAAMKAGEPAPAVAAK